ncbi:DNA polymerase III subunit delta [Caldanaerobacter sp.]|uniref:DNA polymerase III subunit delta n=1 Tax=Caldanaerobacter sp. TaxID=2930036 RepID=UPI003C713E5C
MNYKEFVEKLKKGEIYPFYLFYGEERFLVLDALRRLKSKLLSSEFEDLNYVVVEKENPAEYVEEIIENCETLPFFSNYKIVVVKNEEDQLAKLEDKELKRLTDYFNNRVLGNSNLVLVILGGEKVDWRRKFYKFAEKEAAVVEFKRLTPEEAVNYVGYFLKKHGKKISRKDAEDIVKNIGTDLFLLVNELEKIVAYSEEETIDLKKVEVILSATFKGNIFNLVNALGMKKEKEAYKVLYALLLRGEVPFVILAMIVRQIRLIAKFKALEGKTLDKKSIASRLGIPVFAVEDVMRQSRLFSKEDLYKAYKECLKCDMALKSGVEPLFALESLVKKLCKQ